MMKLYFSTNDVSVVIIVLVAIIWSATAIAVLLADKMT